MKKILLSAALLLTALAAGAVPARRGQWQTITLTDGSTVRVQLVGDEFMHSLQDADGNSYAPDSQMGLYSRLSSDDTGDNLRRATARRAKATAAMRHMSARRAKDKGIFQGTKKALVILANFTDSKFKTTHDLDHYKQVVNGIGFSDSEYKGSVRDYFRAQSGGTFDIDFDVVGPCPLANRYSYYGRNVGTSQEDAHAGEMVAEACQWAHNQGIDFSQYDWDGDGYVDQVFVLYAGKGEADGGSSSTIWPHMYQLQYSDYGKTLQLDGVTVDTYACSCELNGTGGSNGIGTFCHEFSHCMGFPDLYDTSYSNRWFTMNGYDLMDQGSYNGNGFVPAGYSAYEKNECGWINLHDMTDIDSEQKVEGLKSISEYGDAYIVKNKGNENEYYIVELRNKTGWDAGLPEEGVMITHIDYDPVIWAANAPNTYGTYYAEDDIYGRNPLSNNHAHLTIFHANNANGSYDEEDALYPYGSNNSLTRSSRPAASLYAKNSDGTRYMHVDIKDIDVDDDYSSASMTFAPHKSDPVTPDQPTGDNIFYESFDKCDGNGGNDDKWSSINGTKAPTYDNTGWESGNAYAANQCIKIGTGKVNGSITSPTFTVNGTATLSFMAGAWNADKDGTTLNVTIDSGTGEIADTQFEMTKGAWTNFTTTITANGPVSLAFKTSALRFFLDEVKVAANSTSGIYISNTTNESNRIVGYYTLGGTHLSAPQKGINIVRYANGTSRKVVVE